MINEKSISVPGKKYKNAIAVADGYHIVCPYKNCGVLFEIDFARKGNIARCNNCRKEIKIKRVDV